MVNPVFSKEAAPSVARTSVARRRTRLRIADTAHADRLVIAYHYLCSRGARKFWRVGLERSDLEQVAAIGLIKASRRYDAATDTPFEAYAWQMIVGELMHYVRDYERLVRVPRRLRALERRYVRAHDVLVARYAREPSDAELALEIGVVVTTVDELRRAHHCALPVRLEERDVATASASGAPESDDRLLVDTAFAALETLERRIIVGVYLLGLTQLELGRRLGISAKRVSRIHHSALARMQRATA